MNSSLGGDDEGSAVMRSPWEEHCKRLLDACRFFGISQGRAPGQEKLVREFFQEGKDSREHMLASNESSEIRDIYELWNSHIDEFPGLKEHIAECIASGPLIAEDENPQTSSNKARNDAFVYVLAGHLVNAGLDVIAVDGIPRAGNIWSGEEDIVIHLEGQPIAIQCKRPQAMTGIDRNVKRAAKQVNNTGIPGIVALDCSRVIRRPEAMLGTRSAEIGQQFITDVLQEKILPGAIHVLPKTTLGIVLFARVPGVTQVRRSVIVSDRGQPYIWHRGDSICSWVVWPNRAAGGTDLLWYISKQIELWQGKRRRLHNSVG